MNKTKRIISVLLLISLMFANFSNVFARTIAESNTINLVHDHDCISLLKVKGIDMLKGIAYVCYIDPDTGIRYPAFCVEPENAGVGTGGGDSYDVSVSQLDNPVLWRILYKGYVGSSYTDWELECDDDLYYATKTAVHSFAEGSVPTEKYEVPHRVGYGEDISLEDVQRRAAKVLDVAQKLYEYGINGKENYAKAQPVIAIRNRAEGIVGGTKYLIQSYEVISNKELSSYEVEITGFPNGTKIFDESCNEAYNMTRAVFRIAIPLSEITYDFMGTVNVKNAKVKSYPIFYADSGNDDTQDYVIIDANEIASASIDLTIESHNSSLKVIKKDEETETRIPDVVFNFKYADGENIGDFTTDSNGEIVIDRLKQGTVIVTEIEAGEKYILDSEPKEVKLEYGKTTELNVTNERIDGYIKIIKKSSEDSEITKKKMGDPIEGVRFGVYDEDKNLIKEIVTDENGEAITEKLVKGKYFVKELETDEWYLIDDNFYEVDIANNEEVVTLEVQNEPKKPEVDVEKTGPEITKINQEIKYDFEIKSTGNVELNEFTWYDFLPYEQAKITKLSTGTYNQDINYSIYYKTNKKVGYMVLKKDLSSTVNNYIDLNTIYLEDDECITEIKVNFGSVDVGFSNEEKPSICVMVNEELEDGSSFVNETILEGKHQNYKVCDDDTVVTTVSNKIQKKLPRTGF